MSNYLMFFAVLTVDHAMTMSLKMYLDEAQIWKEGKVKTRKPRKNTHWHIFLDHFPSQKDVHSQGHSHTWNKK